MRVPEAAVSDGLPRFLPSAEGRALGDMDAEPYIAVELGTNANEQARKQERPRLTSLSAFNTNGRQCGATWQSAGGYRFGSWAACDRGGEA